MLQTSPQHGSFKWHWGCAWHFWTNLIGHLTGNSERTADMCKNAEKNTKDRQTVTPLLFYYIDLFYEKYQAVRIWLIGLNCRRWIFAYLIISALTKTLIIVVERWSCLNKSKLNAGNFIVMLTFNLRPLTVSGDSSQLHWMCFLFVCFFYFTRIWKFYLSWQKLSPQYSKSIFHSCSSQPSNIL